MTCTIQSMPSMHDSTVHDIENPWTSQSMEDDGSILQRHFCRTMQTCGLHRRGVASAHPSSCTTPWSPQGAVNIEINCCSYILYIHIIIYIAYIIYIYIHNNYIVSLSNICPKSSKSTVYIQIHPLELDQISWL